LWQPAYISNFQSFAKQNNQNICLEHLPIFSLKNTLQNAARAAKAFGVQKN